MRVEPEEQKGAWCFRKPSDLCRADCAMLLLKCHLACCCVWRQQSSTRCPAVSSAGWQAVQLSGVAQHSAGWLARQSCACCQDKTSKVQLHLCDLDCVAVLYCFQCGAHDVCGMQCSLPGRAKAPSGQTECFAAWRYSRAGCQAVLCCIQCQVQCAMQPSRWRNSVIRKT